jgi:hypothetical protein
MRERQRHPAPSIPDFAAFNPATLAASMLIAHRSCPGTTHFIARALKPYKIADLQEPSCILRVYRGQPEEISMAKILAALALSAAFATPAIAQSTFYIVQDTKTKRCSIVTSKPTTKTVTVVGPTGTVYKTRTQAEAAMKTVKVCETR